MNLMEYSFWIVMGCVLGIAVLSVVIQKTFKNKNMKFSTYQNSAGKNGAEVANDILRKYNINNVMIVAGKEGQDHYNPKTNTVSLSPSVYNSSSISAAAIAAHEVGHVIQWAKQEKKIKVRDALVKPVQAISKIGNLLIMMSFFLVLFTLGSTSNDVFIWMGIGAVAVYGATGIFQFATLPVEFDASKKAMKELKELNIVQTREEEKGAKSLLNSAALTYVFAFLASIIMFTLFLLMLLASRR